MIFLVLCNSPCVTSPLPGKEGEKEGGSLPFLVKEELGGKVNMLVTSERFSVLPHINTTAPIVVLKIATAKKIALE